MSPTLAVARATVVELSRRRLVVVLMVLVPLAFYGARHELLGQSIRFLGVGLAWALSTLAAFAGIAGQMIDPRLRLSGYRARQLMGGRLIGLGVLSTALAALYAGVVLVDRDLDRPGGVALGLGLVVVVAVPFGLLVAAVLRRPLEAAMVLLVVSGLSMILDPAGPESRLLPFWSFREVITWTVEGTDGTYVTRALAHAACTILLAGGGTAVVRARSLRRRRHLVMRSEQAEEGAAAGRV
jgi:hypothetical protein